MTKIKAIKKHISEKGDNYVIVTEGLIKHWWTRFNNALFDGELIPPKKIVCRNFRDNTLGWCEAETNARHKQVVLGIRRDLVDKKQFFTVLIHEMVHHWQHQRHGKMSHGKTFLEWQSEIKRKTGLPLNQYVEI